MKNIDEICAELSQRVLNVPDKGKFKETAYLRHAYIEGHRDARHAAVEVVVAYLAEFEAKEKAEVPHA